jgi:hypothetical protein
MLAILAVLATIVAWLLTHRNPIVNPAPVYGGPPAPLPHPPALLTVLWHMARKLR